MQSPIEAVSEDAIQPLAKAATDAPLEQPQQPEEFGPSIDGPEKLESALERFPEEQQVSSTPDDQKPAASTSSAPPEEAPSIPRGETIASIAAIVAAKLPLQDSINMLLWKLPCFLVSFSIFSSRLQKVAVGCRAYR